MATFDQDRETQFLGKGGPSTRVFPSPAAAPYQGWGLGSASNNGVLAELSCFRPVPSTAPLLEVTRTGSRMEQRLAWRFQQLSVRALKLQHLGARWTPRIDAQVAITRPSHLTLPHQKHPKCQAQAASLAGNNPVAPLKPMDEAYRRTCVIADYLPWNGAP